MWGRFALTHNPTKFDGNWRCETGDAPLYKYNVIMVVVDGCGQLNLSHTLLKLVTIVLVRLEIKLFLIPRDQIMNESRDSVGQIPST